MILEWHGETLSAKNGREMYIPEGIAHRFQPLEDDSDVLYQMSEFYDPECARAVRWMIRRFGSSGRSPRSSFRREIAYTRLTKREAFVRLTEHRAGEVPVPSRARGRPASFSTRATISGWSARGVVRGYSAPASPLQV
jgi:hypothetical protein